VDTSKGYAKRVTFVIGPDGKILQTFPKVKIEGHSEEALQAAKASMVVR